jgi:tetratricopeptide (TPR) repeat protein
MCGLAGREPSPKTVGAVGEPSIAPTSPSIWNLFRDVNVGGDFRQFITQGIPPEQFQRLAEELGVTRAALTSFFTILEQHQVPPEDLDATLREIAAHYTTLLEWVRTLSADDPRIAQLREEAEAALQEGEFDRAEHLLNEASARDVEAAQELREMMATRLVAAAEAKATNGALKATQLAYAEAADYYRQATELVEQLPEEREEHLPSYLNEWGVASYQAGHYRAAEQPLGRALAIREQVLGADHPHVATSLNNLAALYRAQGRYSEAEPLYQRALAILCHSLGREHPTTQTVQRNLAALAEPSVQHQSWLRRVQHWLGLRR